MPFTLCCLSTSLVRWSVASLTGVKHTFFSCTKAPLQLQCYNSAVLRKAKAQPKVLQCYSPTGVGFVVSPTRGCLWCAYCPGGCWRRICWVSRYSNSVALDLELFPWGFAPFATFSCAMMSLRLAQCYVSERGWWARREAQYRSSTKYWAA